MTEQRDSIVDGAIVVGVDGSDSSRDALQWAVDQAKISGREVVAVAAWELPSTYGALPGWPDDLDLAGVAQAQLDESVDQVLEGDGRIKLTKVVAQGHPSLVLEGMSKSASLIVVGSRGRGSFAGMLLGSVSQFLATRASCPVVIVRQGG